MDNYAILLIIAILVPPIIVAIIARAKRAKLKKESDKQIKNYKDMLAQRMELESDGMQGLKEEIDRLKKENENLRISLNTFAVKPGRREMLKFNAYQNAVEKLCITNPGFASAWHSTVKEIEENQTTVFTGRIPFIKKILPKKDATLLLEEENKDFS